MATVEDGYGITEKARDPLDRLFAPRSIAIVGSSNARERMGGTLLANLLREYEGDIYPIHPREDSVQGVRAYRSLKSLPQVVDMVLIAVAAELVIEIVEDAAALGVGGALVITAGFAEAGPEGAALQDRLEEIAKRTGIRIIGPNCIGYMNFWTGAVASFALAPNDPLPVAGPVALVSQSGGFGSYLTTKGLDTGLRLGWVVSTGNEVDVNVAGTLRYLVEQDNVKVLLAFAETLRDPATFAQAARRAQELDKVIIILKAGRSEEGARAAMSHTASTVGSADVFDACSRQMGIIVAETMEEMLDFGMIFQDGRRMQGKRVAIVSSSGGAGVLGADEAARAGLQLPKLSEPEQERLREHLQEPFYGTVANPIDTTAQIMNRADALSDFLIAVGKSGEIDAVMPVIWSSYPWMIDAVRNLYESTDKPVAVLSTALSPDLKDCSVPTFTDPRRAMRALSALATHSMHRPPSPDFRDMVPIPGQARERLRIAPGETVLMEYQGKRLLADYDIPVTREYLVASLDEAIDAAARLGGTVVLKAMSYAIPHKSDVGAIRIGLSDTAAVRDAYGSMLEEVARKAPAANVVGVLVQEMVPARLEMTCGFTQDPVFGPIVAVGLGGVLIEVLAENALLRPPFEIDTARAAIASLCDGRLLSGSRGLDHNELAQLARLICSVGKMAIDLPEISEVDINPIRIANGAIVAADALIVVRQDVVIASTGS